MSMFLRFFIRPPRKKRREKRKGHAVQKLASYDAVSIIVCLIRSSRKA